MNNEVVVLNQDGRLKQDFGMTVPIFGIGLTFPLVISLPKLACGFLWWEWESV